MEQITNNELWERIVSLNSKIGLMQAELSELRTNVLCHIHKEFEKAAIEAGTNKHLIFVAQKVVNIISDETNITTEQIYSGLRKAPISKARFICFKILRDVLGYDPGDVAYVMMRKHNHSSTYGAKMVDTLCRQDKGFKRVYDGCVARVCSELGIDANYA